MPYSKKKYQQKFEMIGRKQSWWPTKVTSDLCTQARIKHFLSHGDILSNGTNLACFFRNQMIKEKVLNIVESVRSGLK